MTGGLEGRVALVTGGGRGIGRAICLALADSGARVAVTYRVDAEAADRTVDDIRWAGGEAVGYRADVGDPEQVATLVARVAGELGPVDHLVNNAGFSRLTPAEDLGFAEWRKVLTVNLDGPFLTTWAVKDGMLTRGRGSIVNVASVAGIEPNPDQIHYGTSKAALIYFTRTCARAFAAAGVRVNCVAPGLTRTDRVGTVTPDVLAATMAKIPMGRAGQPEEVAAAVRFLLSDEAGYITGQCLAVSGGRG
ncbi:MAG TPA: glucose 1-dehydrogenase [Acidimicrobiales bacterium]|nr:glucose 1-dehydrogenase [Acidimicrobiales bacterium]